MNLTWSWKEIYPFPLKKKKGDDNEQTITPILFYLTGSLISFSVIAETDRASSHTGTMFYCSRASQNEFTYKLQCMVWRNLSKKYVWKLTAQVIIKLLEHDPKDIQGHLSGMH